jgi:RNA polymerase sigma factor (sigma-70 family)
MNLTLAAAYFAFAISAALFLFWAIRAEIAGGDVSTGLRERRYFAFAISAALFLFWASRVEIAGGDVSVGLRERLDLSFSTGGSADGPRKPTEEQRRALRSLCSAKMQAELRDWLRRLGIQRQARDDVAQLVMEQAARSIHTFDRSKGEPRRWLNGVALRVTADFNQLARHRREELNEDPARGVVDASFSADELLSAEEHRLTALDLLSKLPDRERGILIGHDFDERPMAELAAEHRVPISTAYKIRARALAALTRLVREILSSHD